MACYDALTAETTREVRRKQMAPETVAQIDSEGAAGLELTIKEGFHTKRECKLWIVQLSTHVDRTTFLELKRKASMLGGWYSSFVKSQAGFQFKEESSAQKFCSLLQSDVDREEELAARKARKMDSASERLKALALEIRERAQGTLEADTGKLKNTVRRAEMAAGVRAEAYIQLAFSNTIEQIATELELGRAKSLDGIRAMTQVKTLLHLLRRAKTNRLQHEEKELRESGQFLSFNERETRANRPLELADIRFAQYPLPTVYKRNLEEAVLAAKSKRGVKQAATQMAKRLRGEKEELVTFRTEYDIEKLRDFLSRANAAGVDTTWLSQSLEDFSRLRRANIHTLPELRAALRELLPLVSKKRDDDPITKAEDELRGKKLSGFFPTPRSIIQQMIDLAEIQPGQNVLEPSCGKGDILDAISEAHPDASLTAIEQNHALEDILDAKGHQVTFADFLDHHGSYDRILMNPPFENGADIDHVRHAYNCLSPGGRLVAIMSEGPFFRGDAKAIAFRTWLEELGGTAEPLPDGVFTGTEAFCETHVRTRIVTIDRP